MMAPAAVASAVQPPEIQFAQRLAANEKRIRDRALKKLRGYIILRAQNPAGGFNQEEFLKIWKGLFYCMWMQDKPLLQEELSNNISQLINVIENMDARHLFIQTFWQTMNREWNGIDRLRLDKFYMLIRMVLRQSFEVLKRNGWNESLTEPLLSLLMREAIHSESHAPIGIKLHFIDIYLEELAKVGAKELTADQNLKFIEPFCKTAAKTKDHHLLQAIIHGVFETIVDQCPFAIEDLMRELKASSDDDLSEDDDWDDEENKLAAKNRSLQNKISLDGEAEENILDAADDNIGPVLQFDYKSIADMLFGLASRKNTPAFNRKHLYKLVKKFQDLAEGTFPQDDFPEDVSTDEDDDTFSRKKWKRKSGKPLDETKLKKDNARNRKTDMEENGGNTELRKKKKRKRKLSQVTDPLTATGSQQNEPVVLDKSTELTQDDESADINKRQKKSLDTDAVSVAHPVGGLNGSASKETLTCLVTSVKKKPKKKSGSLWKDTLETVHQNRQVPTSTGGILDHSALVDNVNKVIKKRRKKVGIITGNGFPEEAVKQPEKQSCASVFQKVKLRKKQKLSILEKMRGSKKKLVSLKKKKKIKETLNIVNENELEAGNKKSKASESSGSLIMLQKMAKAGNDFVTFEKTTPPKPVFFRKAKGSIASIQFTRLQSSSSKKVTFGLNRNMTAEFKKTDKSILVSPQGASRVAFNPEQKPPHGVLKSASGSPETAEIKKSSLVSFKKRPTAVDFF
ncbi:ribosomal RNA processing protein 1 homolog B [Sphaerodactylus townsendi]|uniref:ribosomal RNA processing protein 1 homolog B n=1 Tax=Sphaerodactylus townsendi TaxID=933632 RepID=UPI0020270083|nr:ribosomal RNA processing protein 1 homolog B [Sphaerodactylus townsendi]